MSLLLSENEVNCIKWTFNTI